MTEQVKFKATSRNTGAMTINGKNLHLKKDGKSLKAGDLVAGKIYDLDIETGEVNTEQGK